MKRRGKILGNGKKRETKAHELSHLNLWHSLVNVNDSEILCKSVVLKQLKNSSPQRIVTFIIQVNRKQPLVLKQRRLLTILFLHMKAIWGRCVRGVT